MSMHPLLRDAHVIARMFTEANRDMDGARKAGAQAARELIAEIKADRASSITLLALFATAGRLGNSYILGICDALSEEVAK